jgi:thiol-disulfide isomerase/thioredoxin
MIKKISVWCLALTMGLFTISAQAQENKAPEPTLKVGMKAPKLEVGQWFKGKPVSDFTPGHVYVLEFWATWCGPCRSAMPHLSELARQYKGKVTFLGLDVWEHGKEAPAGDYYEKARTFTERLAEGMDYTVGADAPNKYLEENYLKPAGIRGIPSSFIVDQKGDIVWIGHPMNIDDVLELVVKGEYNETAKAALKEKSEKLNEQFKEYNTKLKEYTEAKDYKNQIALLDQMMKERPSNKNSYLPAKFKALLATNPKAAAKMATSLLKNQKGNPILLSSVASTILESDKADKKMVSTAVSMAKVVEARNLDKDYSTNVLLGKAYHKLGDTQKAVAAQQVVVDFLAGYPSNEQIDKMKAAAAETLEKYKNGK